MQSVLLCYLIGRLTRQLASPKIKPVTVRTDIAKTTCDSSLQHSCLSKGSDGQSVGHIFYTAYNVLPALVAVEQKKKKWCPSLNVAAF